MPAIRRVWSLSTSRQPERRHELLQARLARDDLRVQELALRREDVVVEGDDALDRVAEKRDVHARARHVPVCAVPEVAGDRPEILPGQHLTRRAVKRGRFALWKP